MSTTPERDQGNGAGTLVLLGPQVHEPNLNEVFTSLDLPDGPIAVVTAGWQEREGEDEELDQALGGRSTDLEVYRRSDRVYRSDPELAAAHRDVQRSLRELERLYDLRLSYAMESVLRLAREKAAESLLEPEREDAMRSLRELDAWHLKRILEIRSVFEERWRPGDREAVRKEREEMATILDRAPAVVITGGHVAVLLTRLRLFGFRELLAPKPVIAWSAGAMVLTERVVVFHDSPPQGPGNAEVLEEGLGLAPGLVALPHGRRRLRLEDRSRVASMARRFHPQACVVMEQGSRLDWDGSSWNAGGNADRLTLEGEVEVASSW